MVGEEEVGKGEGEECVKKGKDVKMVAREVRALEKS